MTGRGARTSCETIIWSTLLAALVGLLAISGLAARALSKECSVTELAAAVDEVGSSLRTYNQSAMPDVDAKMQQLRIKKGWSEQDFLTFSSDYLHDARMSGLDEKANRLLLRIDSLGPREGEANVDCARIPDVRASGLELLAVMKAKTAHMINLIDSEVSGRASAPPPNAKMADDPFGAPDVAAVETDPLDDAPLPPRADPKPPAPAVTSPSVGAPPSEGGPATQSEDGDDWETGTHVTMQAPAPLTAPEQTDPGYTIEEIRDATRGFFGTISTNLATVIEHAFKSWGRPSAYVLGNEGGGAFLAGLRYGKGTLYLRSGGRRRVFWHGPSVGYDVGAEGSRTMFLIYNLKSADSLYRSYTGVDGSAYLVGGVGLTLLKGGKVIMAPIRTGVGLRVGANLGYVRFTPTATWNPF